MRVTLLATVFATAFMILAGQFSTASPIKGGSATYEYFNSFVTRLFPGTPFNPEPSNSIDIVVESNGVFTQVWQDQIGNAIQDELTSLRQLGALPGDPPIPFEIVGGIEETPQLGPFVGSLTNIVQNPNDAGFTDGAPSSLTSAFRRVAGPFAQVLIDGTFLYAIDDYAFETTVTGLPFPVGSEFVGTADSTVQLRVQLGPTLDPINDPVIGLALPGGVVTITRIVPEPATGWMLAVGTVGVLSHVRSKRCGKVAV